VSFVSPDGTEELTVQQVGSVTAATETVTAERLGADTVVVGSPEPVGEATQLVYRTTDGSLRRTSWLRVLPVDHGAWTVRLTVPGERTEPVAAELFTVLADRFVAPEG
jgi:hypothetical protein